MAVSYRLNIGLVIEGAALATALLRHNAQPFLGLCQACRGVVCCRVTPMQKAQVVSLVKKTGAITLGTAFDLKLYHNLMLQIIRTLQHVQLLSTIALSSSTANNRACLDQSCRQEVSNISHLDCTVCPAHMRHLRLTMIYPCFGF